MKDFIILKCYNCNLRLTFEIELEGRTQQDITADSEFKDYVEATVAHENHTGYTIVTKVNSSADFDRMVDEISEFKKLGGSHAK